MKNDIAVYFGKTTWLKNTYYNAHLKFLEGADFINSSKTDIEKYKSYISFNNVHNKAIDLYEEKYNEYDTWQDFYDELDVSYLKNYSLFVVYFPQIILQWGDNKKTNFKYDNLKYKSFLKFKSYGRELSALIAIAKASEIYQIPLYQISFEVGCLDLRNAGLKPYKYIKFHGYKYKDLECLSSLPYYYVNSDDPFLEYSTDKKYDFVYCGTYSSKQCPHKIEEIKTFKINYLQKFKKSYLKFIDIDKKSECMPYENYIDLLRQSKYTYITTSYIKDVFAIDRFMTAIFNDCLPLISEDTNAVDVSETFNYDFNKLKINNYEINEENRKNTINELKQILFVNNPKEIFNIE